MFVFDLWYFTFRFRFTKFDLSSPAVSRGLPITQVICRMDLLDILVNAVGSDILRNKSKVVDFIQDPNKVEWHSIQLILTYWCIGPCCLIAFAGTVS